MARDVLCDVVNCKYWAEGDRCVADQIYVIGLHGKKADDVDETGCKTFEQK